MLQAFCSSRFCDPKQVSARGKLKSEVLPTQTICECGAMLVWHNSRFRPGLNYPGKNVKLRRERTNEFLWQKEEI